MKKVKKVYKKPILRLKYYHVLTSVNTDANYAKSLQYLKEYGNQLGTQTGVIFNS